VADTPPSLSEAETDPRLGRTPEERLAALARARPIATLCRRATFVLCAWLVLWPVPYPLVFTAVAALPWLALFLCWKYRGAFAIDNPGRKSPRGDVTLLLALPAGVLAMRALIDSHLAIVGPVFMPAVALWCAMVWCARALGPGWRQWRKLPLLVLVSLPYALAGIALADQVFDLGASQTLRLPVIAKRVTTGKSATHYLRVPAWGLRPRPNEIEVKRDVYDAVPVGGAVCLQVHPGALGMPWYEVNAAGGC
jgi:hypothetical protein